MPANIYLTFDLDWCSDEVLFHTLGLLEKENLAATFFITHKTRLLEAMRRNANFELGLHPNFEPLFKGGETASADDVLRPLAALVPEARSVRPHCLTQSSALEILYRQYGLTHASAVHIPASARMELNPWRSWSGLFVCPFFWEDDLHCRDVERGLYADWRAGVFLDLPGLKIFNFHPIHLFLNTKDLSGYERCRPFFHDASRIGDFVNQDQSAGSAVFLRDLIAEARARGLKFDVIRHISPL